MGEKYQADFPDLFHVLDQVDHIESQADKFAPQLKHSNQQSKIVELMKNANLLCGDFVEYGAGKAGLSSFIALEADKKSSFIVVEREARRNKKDKKIRAQGIEVKREMMDIKDFDLSYFSDKKNIIGVAKHLCGGATDLSLVSFKLVT